MQNNSIILEVCAANVESARAAAEGEAQRIELCTALELDGLTPSEEEIRQARAIEGLRVNVLIRLREGDFVYSPEEIATMAAQIETARRLGADGVVIGALTPEGDIDLKACRQMMEAAGEMEVTFHRAFDVCRHPRKALEEIIALGCHRLLTSGQAAKAADGTALIRELQEQAQGRIILMPGSGVTPDNAQRILAETGCREIHSSARRPGDCTTSAEVVSAIINHTRDL